jgi:DNA mismatch repair protein MutL
MLRVLGQVSATYIIAEGPDGLYLIDQHAAHERVMYEQIRGQMSAGQSEQQPYLDPLIVELDQHETAVMDRSLPELRQIGFDIETFGEQSYVIRAIPAIMANVDIRERIHLILRELGEGGVGDSWLDSVAISAACHTSIRAGQLMSIAEMRELVAQLERTEHPRACGHGRPTMLLMSQVDLEKQFSRR